MTEKWRNFLFHPTGCTMGYHTFWKSIHFFFYHLLLYDTFVNLTKMWKQRFMKKRILRKKVNPLCTASDFRGKGGCWEALLLKNSIVQVWNTLLWLACASARKTQRYAKMGSKIFWGRVSSFCAVGFHKKKMKVVKQIYKAFGLIVIKYVHSRQ